jgi:thiopurine S-methyltransferase
MHEEWLARWREGRIGFHEGRPNALLEHHHAHLAGARRVLVPLCGKSEDLAFLAAHGHEVIGAELAEQAVAAFFAEHALTPTITPIGPLVAYRASVITIFVGDIFAVTPDICGPIDGFYDRGAVVALPDDVRPRYAAHLHRLLSPAARGIVIAVEYDQALMTGPPFSVPDRELRTLYPGAAVDLLAEQPLGGTGRCSQAGVPAIERCYSVRLDGAPGAVVPA